MRWRNGVWKSCVIAHLLRGICSNVEDDKVKKWLDRFFTPLAEAYIEICDKQKRQFFGLRDFYRYAAFYTSPSSSLLSLVW